MKLLANSTNESQTLKLYNLKFEFPRIEENRVPHININKCDIKSLESMIEYDVKRFHKKSKNEVITIYQLSQEVLYSCGDKNPELAELAASLFLFCSDFTWYLNIEESQFIPAVQGLIHKYKISEIIKFEHKPVIKDLIRKIRLEHHAAIEKLVLFKTLTKDYEIPVGARNSYHLLFTKLKKFQSDLIAYLHFENKRLFPLAIRIEDYMNKK
jgi:regulator of cell morphogenesis and NO signaling